MLFPSCGFEKVGGTEGVRCRSQRLRVGVQLFRDSWSRGYRIVFFAFGLIGLTGLWFLACRNSRFRSLGLGLVVAFVVRTQGSRHLRS